MAEIKAIETFYNGYRFRSRLEARWAVFFDALGVKYEYEPEGFQLPSGDYYLPDFRVKCYGTRGAFEEQYTPCEWCKHRKAELIECCAASPWSQFCELFDSMERYNNNTPWPEWITIRNKGLGEIIACRKKDSGLPFDLYVEVKGVMSQKDADKIHEFADTGAHVLVVGNIPNPDTYLSDLHGYEEMNGVRIYPWNYETIDGDYFAAYPAVRNGQFYLDGDDSNYQTMNTSVIRQAFIAARQARFEHGEKPNFN